MNKETISTFSRTQNAPRARTKKKISSDFIFNKEGTNHISHLFIYLFLAIRNQIGLFIASED